MARLVLGSAVEVSRSDRALRSRNLFVNRLYTQYYEALLGFLRSRLRGDEGEARDVAQASYLRLCRQPNLDKIRGRERAYLFKTACNLLRDRQRRTSVRANAQSLGLDSAVSAGAETVDVATPLTTLEYKQTLATVRQAVRGMSPRTRRVFLMRRLQEMSYREIAEKLGISERTVERRMHKALRCLKRELLNAAQPASEAGMDLG